jgi:hypothetical protein
MANEFFNINSFRESLNSGSKANLFRCELTGLPDFEDPENVFADDKFSFLCRSAAIPSYSLGVIEVPFRGRRIKVPGDRVFTDWTVTVVNDENQGMRKAFDNWMKYINDPDGEEVIREDTASYRCNIKITHFKADGTISRVYLLADAFPVDVSAIELSYDAVDVIQDFSVTFQYHYMEAGGTAADGTDASGPSIESSSVVEEE